MGRFYHLVLSREAGFWEAAFETAVWIVDRIQAQSRRSETASSLGVASPDKLRTEVLGTEGMILRSGHRIKGGAGFFYNPTFDGLQSRCRVFLAATAGALEVIFVQLVS